MKNFIKPIRIVFVHTIFIVIFLALVGGALYCLFCPENIKDTILSISLILGLYLCGIIYDIYDKLRRNNIISAKTVSMLNNIGMAILTIILGLPIIGCLIGGVLWLLNII